MYVHLFIFLRTWSMNGKQRKLSEATATKQSTRPRSNGPPPRGHEHDKPQATEQTCPPSSPATSSLDLQTVNKDQWSFFHVFFFNSAILLQELFLKIFIFYFYFPFSKAASNVSWRINCPMINSTESVCPICLRKTTTLIPTINFWMLHDYRSNAVDQMNVSRSSCKKKKKFLRLATFIDFYFIRKLCISKLVAFFFFQNEFTSHYDHEHG